MLDVVHRCKQIKELHSLKQPSPPLSGGSREAVLQGMLQLQHLRGLTLMPGDDKELGIIGEMLQLRELDLTLGDRCTMAGLLQLENLKEQGQLQGLGVIRGENSMIPDGKWEELQARLSFNNSLRFMRRGDPWK